MIQLLKEKNWRCSTDLWKGKILTMIYKLEYENILNMLKNQRN